MQTDDIERQSKAQKIDRGFHFGRQVGYIDEKYGGVRNEIGERSAKLLQ